MEIQKTVALVVLLSALSAVPANAGPLDALLGGVIGANPAWWLEAVAVVSAGLGLLSALVADSKLGPPWLAALINAVASNWGRAKNDPGQ